jgi:ERCC4-related helicase
MKGQCESCKFARTSYDAAWVNTNLTVACYALHRIVGLSATPGQNKEKINEIIR